MPKTRSIAYSYIFLFTCILAIAGLGLRTTESWSLGTDFFWGFVPKAQEFIGGSIPLEEFRGPLFPITLAIVYLLTSNFFYAGVLISVVCSSVSLYVAFKLFCLVFKNERYGLLAMVIYSLNSIYILASYSAGSDMLFNVFALSAIYLYIKYSHKPHVSRKLIICIGVLIALAFLSRYIGIIILVAILIYEIARMLKMRKFQPQKSVIISAAFLFTIIPYLIINLQRKGVLLWNIVYETTLYEVVYSKQITLFEFIYSEEKQNYKSLLDVITRHPLLTLERMIENIGEQITTDFSQVLGIAVGLLCILGIIKLWRERKRHHHFLLLISLLYFLAMLLSWYVPRYSLLLVPFYTYLAVLGILSLTAFIAGFFHHKDFILIMISIAVICASLANSWQVNQEYFRNAPNPIVQIAEKFKSYRHQHNLENEEVRLATRLAHSTYYLNAAWYEAPPAVESYSELLNYLKEQQVNYILISDHDIAPDRPDHQGNQIQYQILSGQLPAPDLELIYKSSDMWSTEALYRVLGFQH